MSKPTVHDASPRPRGIAFALGSAALFGVSTPAAKLLVGHAHPVMVAALLYLGAGFGLLAYRALRARTSGASLRRADAPWLAGAVLAGGVAGPVLLMLGLRRTEGATASLLLNLEGVFTAAIAWRAFRENVDRKLVLGVLLIVAAGALLAWQDPPRAGGPPWGPILVAGACLCWALDNNLTRKVSAADAPTIVAVKGCVAGAVNFAIALALGAHIPAAPAIAATMALGLVSYGISLVLFVVALRHLGAARAGAYFALAPFVGAAASFAMLGERAGVWFYPAAALMAAGLWLHLAERHAHPHRHARMVHAHAHAHDEHHRHAHPAGTDAVDGHAHEHAHEPLTHAHPHYPDIHHRHEHDGAEEPHSHG